MKIVRLGKTDLEISRIGIGGIPITRPSEEEAVKVIRRALDLGVNFIDTAAGYAGGMSEERIGKAIDGRRDKVVISTKSHGRDKNTALEHLEQSLKRLKTDYIDLWQLHNVSNFEKYNQILQPGGAMEAAEETLQAGKIKHIGISSHSLKVALKAVASDLFETIQFPFNFVSNEAAEELVPLTQKHNVGFIAMKPFAGGRINDANLAIKYLLQFDNVVPDPGIQTVEEIEEIVKIVNGSWELTDQEKREMEEIRARVGTRFCRQCEYCMPCLQGVLIPNLMYLPILYEVWPHEWFFSWRYVQDAVESEENCIQCGECEEKCPYHLPIREIIVENLKFYERVAQGKGD